jgi:hypothetical protein
MLRYLRDVSGETSPRIAAEFALCAPPIPHFPQENWLSGMDSNHDKELQRLLCYHYTTGQDRHKLAACPPPRKEKTPAYFP